MADTVGEPVADRSPAVTTYRPHLDGLRAVAVYLVVLFHAGIGRFSGGYVGVDVFFVLSGFLVTQVLLRDLDGGSVRFGRFYARRFRRLLPAAFVALIGTALLVAALDPVQALASVRAFQAAFVYSSNWYFIAQSTDYFAADVARNPVLQFWSLAVEEQFYLVWPVLLAVLFRATRRLGRRQLPVVRLAVLAGALASVGWALHLRVDDPNRAYFGTDTRAYQLLAGAAIALLPGLVASLGRSPRAVRVVAAIGVVGVVLVGTSLAPGDAIVRGVVATVVTVVALVALEASTGGVTQRVLSSEPLVYLGRISYGTYLWHWPVVLVATSTLRLDPRATAVLTILVATGLASLSHRLLEQPVREARVLDRHRLVVIGVGLTISVVSALVVVPAIVDPGPSGSTAAPAAGATAFTPVPDWVDTKAIYLEGFGLRLGVYGTGDPVPSCLGAAPEQCTIVHGSGAHVLLMGDSNAVMMIPAFTKLAQENDLTLSLELDNGCPWQRSLYHLSVDLQEACRLKKEDAYNRVIPALDPDVVVGINVAEVEDPVIGVGVGRPEEFEEATRASVAELEDGHRQVVIIEPVPMAPEELNPLTCLESAAAVEDCRYVTSTDATWYERFTRELAAADPNLHSADLDRLVCPYLPICDPIIGGVVVHWNRQHLTTRFSETLADPLAAYLRDNDLIGS